MTTATCLCLILLLHCNWKPFPPRHVRFELFYVLPLLKLFSNPTCTSPFSVSCLSRYFPSCGIILEPFMTLPGLKRLGHGSGIHVYQGECQHKLCSSWFANSIFIHFLTLFWGATPRSDWVEMACGWLGNASADRSR